MAQAKSPEVKARIIAAWHEASAKGETRKSFHERIKGTELEITYGGLERWLSPPKAKNSGSTEAFTAVHTESSNIITAATLDDVEAAYKKSIETLIANLEEQEHQLKGEIERVMNDLARAREKLTKFD
ncbi:hypothetical protein FFH90_023540 [Pseudomonas sp. ATCC 43928]|uniref:hypothetical protein n=1 Tax=Pseudomonas sp. ATCC 43928 TaxID=676210 RepID=UPI00110D4814|nr:hypothetical protein [Pseudomonas sp. ATCC 43928]QDV97110.1 hypothetical protein FFH90_023540 [Pseudomonas sp. ATCC 43928]